MICTYDEICVSSFKECPAAGLWPNPPATKKGKVAVNIQKEEGNTPMATYNHERTYLENRAKNIMYDMYDKLAVDFHMNVETLPKNYKDLIDWIKNDKFTLDTKKTAKIDAELGGEDCRWYGSPFDGITFTGGIQPDAAGYAIAREAFGKVYQDTKDIILTLDATAGLAALKALEAWTPTTPAN